MTLACLGSGVLQLVDNFLFSDPDLLDGVELLTSFDCVGTVTDSGSLGEGLQELQGSI